MLINRDIGLVFYTDVANGIAQFAVSHPTRGILYAYADQLISRRFCTFAIYTSLRSKTMKQTRQACNSSISPLA
jgi:hypothetical protein